MGTSLRTCWTSWWRPNRKFHHGLRAWPMNTSTRAATEDALRGIHPHCLWLLRKICVFFLCLLSFIGPIKCLAQCSEVHCLIWTIDMIFPPDSPVVLEHVIIARRLQEAMLEGLADVAVATRQDMAETEALEEVRMWSVDIQCLWKVFPLSIVFHFYCFVNSVMVSIQKIYKTNSNVKVKTNFYKAMSIN